MKGAFILLEKNGVLIRTQFVSNETVRWLDGEEKRFCDVVHEDYQIVEPNLVNKGLQMLEKVRDKLCSGWKVTNTDLLEIIDVLRKY